MRGSEFVREFASKGYPAWEAAALQLARQGDLTPWPFADLTLTDGTNTVTLKVATDILAIGTLEDHVRLPMTPSGAQNILNLFGFVMPTPWLAYQIWRAAAGNGVQLEPMTMFPPQATLKAFAEHSAIVDQQIKNHIDPVILQKQKGIVAGQNKDLVVSNIYKPRTVLIFGWYHPHPPYADVYDDKSPWNTSYQIRQPIQAKSNAHDDQYFDYSHGIRAIGPQAIVNGQVMDTVALYQHPTLSTLISNESPSAVRVPRYPAIVTPPAPTRSDQPQASIWRFPNFVANWPSTADYGLSNIAGVSPWEIHHVGPPVSPSTRSQQPRRLSGYSTSRMFQGGPESSVTRKPALHSASQSSRSPRALPARAPAQISGTRSPLALPPKGGSGK